MDIEDSDEEQGLQSLQTNIFNEISSPPNQTTIKSTLFEAEPLGQPTPEQPITHTTDVQSEQVIAGHTTAVMSE